VKIKFVSISNANNSSFQANLPRECWNGPRWGYRERGPWPPWTPRRLRLWWGHRWQGPPNLRQPPANNFNINNYGDITQQSSAYCLRHFVNLQFHPPHKIVHGGKAFGIGQLELTLVGEGVGAWLKDPFVRLSSFGLGNASISILLG